MKDLGYYRDLILQELKGSDTFDISDLELASQYIVVSIVRDIERRYPEESKEILGKLENPNGIDLSVEVPDWDSLFKLYLEEFLDAT